MSTNDGGPAFPCLKKWQADSRGGACNTGYEVREFDGGMSLRDYLAAQAMGAMVAGLFHADILPGDYEASIKRLPLASYNLADAMLAERAKATP